MNRCIEQNPWAGLSSYKDPGKSEHQLIFCGRDGDTYDVTRLIDDNFFMTLYGKSGIGKTSLLNAGVFPALRREQYTPLCIRLGVLEEEIIYQDIIISEVERHVRENGGRVEEIDVIDQQKDCNATDFLWNYFARHRFLNEEGLITFPVVVLDQFEETLQKPEMRRKAEALLAQIHYIIDENHALDDCIIGDEEYVYDFNFRFVLSIREDDLYRLEDSIDNCALTALKRCRYRLRSLSEEGAREVIVKPGEGLFREDEQNLIVDSIIGIARTDKDNSISTNILSLVCNRIYVKSMAAGYDHIPFSFVEKFVKDNPFERFYNEATRDFSEREKTFIEDNLVDSTGRRNSVSEKYFLKNVPKGRKLLEGDTRILQRISASADGENVRVELIHDSFCAPLGNQKEKREARKRRRKLYYSIAFIVLCLGAVAYVVFQNMTLEHTNRKAMENQARFVAEKGQQLIDEGDSYLARLLAINVLPKDLNAPKDRPYTAEAERLLRNAMMTDNAVLRGHGDRVMSASFSLDGKYLISSSWDKSIRIWDVNLGVCVDTLLGHTGYVYEVILSSDGSLAASRAQDGTIRIWDIERDSCIHRIQHKVHELDFSPDNGHLLSIDLEGRFQIRDVKSGECVVDTLLHERGFLCGSSFGPEGDVISTMTSKHLYFWNFKTGNFSTQITEIGKFTLRLVL